MNGTDNLQLLGEPEENLDDSGRIIYDWNPPVGYLEKYYYHRASITYDEVCQLFLRDG